MAGLLLGASLVGIPINHGCGQHRIAVDRTEGIEQPEIGLYKS